MKDLKKDDLIFPTLLRQIGENAYRLPYPKELEQPIQNHITSSFGLTKRELFAAMALQGMLSHPTRYKPREGSSNNWHEAISEEAVQIADALITELNKEEK